MVQLNEYELQRLKRIEENKRRMEELGMVEASQAIAASKAFTEASQALPRAPRRPPQYVILKAEDLRRSVRAKKEVDYNEHNLFKDAEAALRKAEALQRTIVIRKQCSRGGSRGHGVRVAQGWHESYGTAGADALERCQHEAHALADRLDNPAFAKVLGPSMVSGGFWCSAPRGLKQAVGISSKCDLAAFLPEGEPIPEGANHVNVAGDGWHIVWLPHGRPAGSSFGFSGNWRGFAIDNRLFPGDCVVFELLPKEEHRASHPDLRFSLRVHVLRAYDYDTAEVKAACQAAWATAPCVKEEETEVEDEEEEEGDEEAGTVAEKEGQEQAQQAQQAGEKEGGQAQRAGEQEQRAPQAGEQQQQQHSEGSPAPQAAAAAELSLGAMQAEQGEGTQDAAVSAAVPAPGASAPRRKRQIQMTEAASSKRARRTSVGGQPGAAGGAKQMAAQKSPSAPQAGRRAAIQRPANEPVEKKGPAKDPAKKNGRAAGTQTVPRKGKRAATAAARTAAGAQAECVHEGQDCAQEGQQEEAYEVEHILGVKGRGMGRRVHIKWWGYKETTWEPLSMLDQPLETYPLAPGLTL